MPEFIAFTPDTAARHIAVPIETDDKYSRGVLGVVTGSDRYPGAAVLGVEAALRTGVGMVRYLGPNRASELVLQRRPETVTTNGRVQAWVLGSGQDPADRDRETLRRLSDAASQNVPLVLDGGALDFHHRATGPVVITPHFRELARVQGVPLEQIAADPAEAAARAAHDLGVTVLLKGHTTYVAGPGTWLSAASAPSWLATAGAGDALAGILGALLATHASEIAADATMLARLAATASVIHGLAATRASGGGPLTIMDLASAIPATIAAMLSKLQVSSG